MSEWLPTHEREYHKAQAELQRRSEPAEAHPDVRVVASECDLYGHDYQVRDHDYILAGRVPEAVFCPRCGKSWKVER